MKLPSPGGALSDAPATAALDLSKRHADENVEGGRAYVAACVEHVHYVENLHLVANNEASGHTEIEPGATAGAHGHK